MDKRLEAIVAAVRGGAIVADIACDHGYIGYELLKRGIAERVIFGDISQACLNKAVALASTRFGDRAEFVHTDGLTGIEADEAVIAGLGGLEIADIIERAEHKPELLTLQPMRKERELRERLSPWYSFQSDKTIYSRGKYYVVMRLERGSDSMTEAELTFGRTNVAAPEEDFVRYILKEKRKCESVLTKSRPEAILRRAALIDMLIALPQFSGIEP